MVIVHLFWRFIYSSPLLISLLIWVLVLFLLCCRSSYNILDINPLLDTWCANIFSCSISCQGGISAHQANWEPWCEKIRKWMSLSLWTGQLRLVSTLHRRKSFVLLINFLYLPYSTPITNSKGGILSRSLLPGSWFDPWKCPQMKFVFFFKYQQSIKHASTI